MKQLGTMRIEQVIGPRLERGGIVVIETQTPFGRVALELSPHGGLSSSGASHGHGSERAPELPQFLAMGVLPRSGTAEAVCSGPKGA